MSISEIYDIINKCEKVELPESLSRDHRRRLNEYLVAILLQSGIPTVKLARTGEYQWLNIDGFSSLNPFTKISHIKYRRKYNRQYHINPIRQRLYRLRQRALHPQEPRQSKPYISPGERYFCKLLRKAEPTERDILLQYAEGKLPLNEMIQKLENLKKWVMTETIEERVRLKRRLHHWPK